jgi:hypothetical protein
MGPTCQIWSSLSFSPYASGTHLSFLTCLPQCPTMATHARARRLLHVPERSAPTHGRSRRGRACRHPPLAILSTAEPGRRPPLAELAGCRPGRSRRGRPWPSSLAPNPSRSSPVPWQISPRSSLAEIAGAMAGAGYIMVNSQGREKYI